MPLAGVQLYLCSQDKGLGNTLEKRKMGNGHTSLLFHCLFSSSPNTLFFVIMFEHLSFPLLLFA